MSGTTSKALLSLSGLNIVITRPNHQADNFCQLIENAGAIGIRFPLLEIKPPDDLKTPLSLIQRLGDFDLAIFVSANAALKGLALFRTQHMLKPAHLKLAAIGSKTKKILEQAGYKVDFSPKHKFTSEAFLEMPELEKMKHSHVIIFRGKGGRELLGNTLKANGCVVEYAEVYQRVKPAFNRKAFEATFSQQAYDLVALTSSMAVQNFYELIKESGNFALLDSRILLGNQRISDKAHELGFNNMIIASDPSDESMLKALLVWQQKRERQS